MPQTEGAMSLTAEDEVELVKAAAKLSRNKGSFKAKLTRQTPVEMSEKRQVLKQESKDSGIVTEMFVRPKENKHSSDNLKEYARQESKSEKKKSLAKRSQSMKIKRTQSCKVKGEREREYLERTHDDSEVSYFLILHVYHFRNLANHLYAKVYETQEDMCRKRNEIRIANMQLGAVRSQVLDVVFIYLCPYLDHPIYLFLEDLLMKILLWQFIFFH